MPGSKLLTRIHEISHKAGFQDIGIAFYDYETSLRFSYHGDRFFHAASTFKAGILLALFKAVEEGKVRLDDHLQIRNRFRSVVDGSTFRIERERDGDSSVHRAIGGSKSIRQLGWVMVTRSSNLATNLLLDYIGLDYVRKFLADEKIDGIEIKRGVEDQLAHQQGINNEATAEGLVSLFSLLLEDDFLRPELREEGLSILLQQEFRSMIPARLPEGTKVAHKTGEISTHCHDAGIVFVPERKPYVLAILVEHGPGANRRNRAIAEISSAIHRYLTGHREDKHAP